MAILRLGTCGATQPPAKLGDMLVASSGSIAVRWVWVWVWVSVWVWV